jgi:alkylation response protein AidB-like acyl-CoA dehydrogenase
MDLEFDELQLSLRDTARTVLAGACPPSFVRAVYEASGEDAAGDVASLWSTFCELDWPGLGLPESVGGLGLGVVEVGIVVEELGRVAAPGPFLATVTGFAAAVRAAGSTFALADVAAGTTTGTLAVAEAGRWDPGSIAASAEPADGGWRLSGTKSHVLDGATADEVVVVARGAAGLGMFIVPASALRTTAPATMDPTMPLASVDLADAVVDGERVLVAPGDPVATQVIALALDEATVAMALSTVSTCRAIFEATVEYAKVREQYGRPIGSFQAVKHRLADCFLAVERAGALAWFAALTIAEDDPRRPLAVAMAKAAAGDCAQLLARDGLQLHGGIGFTWEHDLHFLLKRAVTGDLLFGGGAFHRARAAALMGLLPDAEEAA